MSLPHQALHGTATALRARLPGSGSLKVIGAFAGGVACTGIAVATWSGSLTTSPDRPQERQQYAAAGPSVATDASGLQSAETQTAKAEPTKAEAAKSDPDANVASAAPDTADRAQCDNQVWPYIDQQCLTKATPGAPSRRVRIVSTDTTIASDRTPQPPPPATLNAALPGVGEAAAPPAGAAVPPAAQAALIPVPPVDPRKSAGDTTANAAGSRPPEMAGAVQPAVAVAGAPPREEEPSARQRNASTIERADRRRQRRADRLAQRRLGDDARLLPRRAPDADDDDDRTQPQHGRPVTTQPQHGRPVTVEQTYRLPDGRRVLVRRVYRSMPPGGIPNSEASLQARPMSRHPSFGASAWAADN